ncbi:alpha/beta hydrolase [Romboutsia maritimum]|uniref:Alpha/beta hydrolase n=1 Tax=Romboutsia maritimum TaxID=2020948 RepID=A0A371IUY1_9FIRM|nr:alpha/beta hydrolase [Romboutsia maritimum]RDY24269.1 alpha/beta hydrolase [Romboutsia maritimum]
MNLKNSNIKFIKRKYLNIRYANQSNSQKLDIYLPNKGSGPFPVIVLIHGGKFSEGDKRNINGSVILEGILRGYAVISINYRLTKEDIFPSQIYDVKAAIRYIKSNSKKYSLDKNKVIAWGKGAGGYLCSLLATSSKIKELDNLKMGNSIENCDIQGVINWSGSMDFLTMDSQLKESNLHPQIHSNESSPESILIGEKITKAMDLVKICSPITYISDNTPPFFIQHGKYDNKIPYQQSIQLRNELLKYKKGNSIYFEILENATDEIDDFVTKENLNKVFVFLDNILKNSICQN